MADTTVHTEELGEIVIAPEVLEVIIGITTAKIDGVYALRNKHFQIASAKNQKAVVFISKAKTTKLLSTSMFTWLSVSTSHK